MPELGDWVYVYGVVGTTYADAGQVRGHEYTQQVADLVTAGVLQLTTAPEKGKPITPPDPDNVVATVGRVKRLVEALAGGGGGTPINDMVLATMLKSGAAAELLSGSYSKRGALYLPSDTALLKWRTKANEVISGIGQGHIAVLADSIGYGAGTTGNSLPKHRWSWPGQLRELLDARFGKGGTGIVPAAKASFDNPTWDPRWRWGSAVSSYTFGWHRESSFRMTSGTANSWIEFDAYCDEFIIYGLSASAGVNTAYIDGVRVGTFRNISNAPTVDFPPQAGYSSKQIVSRIPVPSGLGQHTLRIETDNSATGRDAFILGVEGRIGASGAFRVSNHGFNGRSLASFGAKGTNNDETNTLYGLPMLDMTKADLLVMALGINDWQGGGDVAGQKDALRTIIDRQRSAGTNSQGGPHPNGDILLVWNAKPSISGLAKDPELWEAYRRAYYEIADEKNVALLDMSKVWPEFTDANGLGLFADTIHPSDKGAADIARNASIAVVGDAAAVPRVLSKGHPTVPTEEDVPGLLWMPVADAQGRIPEIHIDTAGQVQQWALDRWKSRMGLGGTTAPIDIVIVAGQSNATQRSSLTADVEPAIESVAVWGASSWMTASGVPWLGSGFGREYAELHARPQNRRVGLVKAALGSTGFSSLSPGTWDRTVTTGADAYLYPEMISKAQAALAAAPAGSRIVAVLWSQGENDRSMSATTYKAKLDDLIAQTRIDLGIADLPFIIGSLTPEVVATGSAGGATINAALEDTPRRVVRTSFVPGPANMAEVAGDGIHWSPLGQTSRGAEMARYGLDAAMLNTVDSLPLPPQNIRVSRSGDQVTIGWSHPACRVTAYTIEVSTDGGTTWTAQTLTGPTVHQHTLTVAAATAVRVRGRSANEAGTSLTSIEVRA